MTENDSEDMELLLNLTAKQTKYVKHIRLMFGIMFAFFVLSLISSIIVTVWVVHQSNSDSSVSQYSDLSGLNQSGTDSGGSSYSPSSNTYSPTNTCMPAQPAFSQSC